MSSRLSLWLLVACSAASAAGPLQAQTDSNGTPLPEGAVARLGVVNIRHAGCASSVAFTPDGRTLVSGGHDGTIRLWDAANGRELRTIRGHGNAFVYTVAVSPDGKLIASAGEDQAVYLWATTTGRQVRRLAGAAQRVWTVAFSADGKLLAAVSIYFDAPPAGSPVPLFADGKLVAGPKARVSIWETASGRQVHRLTSDSAVHSLAFALSGAILATGSQDGTIRLWNGAAGREVRSFRAHKGTIESLAWTADGDTLISASNDADRLVRLWNPKTGKDLQRLDGPLPPGLRVAASPKGNLVAAGSNEVRLWDRVTGKQVQHLELPGMVTNALAFSPDGTRLASASSNGTLSLWEVETGKECSPFLAHAAAVTTLSFAPNGKMLASGGDGASVLWDIASQKQLRRFGGAKDAAVAIAFAPDGKTLLAADGAQGVGQWDPATGALRQRWRGWGSGAVAFAPDRKTLAARGADGILASWTVKGERLWQLDEKQYGAAALAYSPDGKIVAAGRNEELPGFGADNVPQTTLRLWRTTTRNPLLHFADYKGRISSLAFSPDSRRLATGGQKVIRIWEVASGKRVAELWGHAGDVHAIAWAPGGRVMASVGDDGAVRLWDSTTSEELQSLKGHQGEVRAVAFSADGRLLATGSADTTVLVWDVSPGRAPPPPEDRPESDELPELWTLLAAKDATEASRAVWRLASVPAEAVPFVAAKLKQASREQAEVAGRLAGLVRNLDHDRFGVREQAMGELARLPQTLVAPALMKALEGQPTLETRRRIEKLLSKVKGPVLVQEGLRFVRAVEVLEHAGTAEAQAALAVVAREAAGSQLAEEATAALERWPRRAALPKRR